MKPCRRAAQWRKADLHWYCTFVRGPLCCLLYLVTCIFETNEDILQILLMWVVLFTQYYKFKDLVCDALCRSDPRLFISDYLFGLGFKPVQEDLQLDFARMTNKADGPVVMAELAVALLREWNE